MTRTIGAFLSFTGVLTLLLAITSPAAAQRGPRGTPIRGANATGARPVAVTGIITAISSTAGTLSITSFGQTGGTAVNLTITSSTAINIDGTTGQGLANLVLGMPASAVYQASGGVNTALQINASSKARVTGSITAVTPASGSTTIGTVTVTPADGSAVTLNVNLGSGAGTTTVRLDGSAVTSLTSLLPGMHAKAEYRVTSSGNNATHLHVNDMIRLHGTISAVMLSAGSTTTGTVTINPASGSAVIVTVNLGNGTTATLNGSSITALNTLASGMRLEVRYQVSSSGNIVSFLKARSGS